MLLILRVFLPRSAEPAKWLPCRPAQAARRLAPAASGQRASSRPLPAHCLPASGGVQAPARTSLAASGSGS